MKLSIVIPVYNEARTIRKIIELVESVQLVDNIEKELIIVNDCSTDETKNVLENLKAPQRKIYHHKLNCGKGAALRTGYSKCTGDIVIVQDADLEYDPHEYNKLIKPILDGKADVVYGSRFMGDEAHRIVYFWHSIGNKILTLLSNMFTDLNLTDMETCYKVFKCEVIQQVNLKENRFGIEPEVTAKIAELAKNKGIRIYEVGYIHIMGEHTMKVKRLGLKMR